MSLWATHPPRLRHEAKVEYHGMEVWVQATDGLAIVSEEEIVESVIEDHELQLERQLGRQLAVLERPSIWTQGQLS